MQTPINLRNKNKKSEFLIQISIPNGKNRMIHKIANHRQSDGRRGACGSNFCRRLTNVAELFVTDVGNGFKP